MPQIYRHAEDFFCPKNPTASAGFQPANLGTKGQHAIPRPPKPISVIISYAIGHSIEQNTDRMYLILRTRNGAG